MLLVLFLVVSAHWPVLNSLTDEGGDGDDDDGLNNPYAYKGDILVTASTVLLPHKRGDIVKMQRVNFRGNVSISRHEIDAYFAPIYYIDGGLIVNGTNFEDLTFLEQLDGLQVAYQTPSKFGLIVINNPRLKSLNVLKNCRFCYDWVWIENNPLLDLTPDCDRIDDHYGINRVIRGNLENCGCVIMDSFAAEMSKFERCSKLYGKVSLTGPDEPSPVDLKRVFEKVKGVAGSILVANTSYTDLSFFASLTYVKSYDMSANYLLIRNNANLKSLNFTVNRDGPVLDVRNNPALCVTTSQVVSMASDGNGITAFDARICGDNSSNCLLAKKDNISAISGACTTVFGDVRIDNTTDLTELYRLFNVTKIFGTVTVHGTKLRTAHFLWQLSHVICFDKGATPCELTDNPWLQTPLGDSYTFAGVFGSKPAIIQRNARMVIFNFHCAIYGINIDAIISDNWANCADANVQWPKEDLTPLNVDVIEGVPEFQNAQQSAAGDVHSESPSDDSTEDPLDQLQKSARNPSIIAFFYIFVLRLKLLENI